MDTQQPRREDKEDASEEVILEEDPIEGWVPEKSNNPHYIHPEKWIFRYDDDNPRYLDTNKFLDGEITEG